MTVKRLWKIMCDECGKVYPHTFIDRTSESALEEMALNNWHRIHQDGGHIDLCADCYERDAATFA